VNEIQERVDNKSVIELRVEEPKKFSQVERGIKNIFKKLDCFLQRDPDDYLIAKIIVFGIVDEDMLEAYDDKFGEIAA